MDRVVKFLKSSNDNENTENWLKKEVYPPMIEEQRGTRFERLWVTDVRRI
jgi:hypothetical protein